MKRHLIIIAIGWLWMAPVATTLGQEKAPPVAPPVQQPAPGADPAKPQVGAPPDPKPQSVQEIHERTTRELKALREEHAREIERQQKQAELQQKQIEVLEKTTRLLADQLKTQMTAPAAVESLESKAAVLDTRSKQAARRDQELLDATNDVRESLDVVARRGQLPYTARELFLPAEANETPLSIYGEILGGYNKQNGQSGLFQSPTFAPWFLLQLNKKFLLEVNTGVSTSGIGLGQAQVDYFATDWLTIVAGRYLTPIGSFNERLSPEWINKLPDIPVMFREVVPQTATDGIQFRGSKYLGALPFKLEYSLYTGNGFQLGQKPTNLTQVANLQRITEGPDAVTSRAYGGRLGLWAPIHGVNFGFSGYTNGIFSPGSQNHYYLWDFDFNYHRGNWDFRAEYADTYQEAMSFLGNNINRRGLYAQVAYRDYQSESRIFKNLEYVFRYGFADFNGIRPSKLNQTAFPTTFDIPVSRNQYTAGINYYFYPSMVLKLAYEINTERALRLNDNIFLAQGVWAF
jgi:hypothetical protein